MESRAATWGEDLRRAGVAPGEPVALVTHNDPAAVIALFAIRSIGAVAAPLHPALAPAEARALAQRLGARLTLTRAPNPPWGTTLPEVGSALTIPRLVDPPKTLEADYVLFTSGTQGRPRGVLLTDERFQLHARAVHERVPLSTRDRWLASLSIAHVGGLALVLRAAQFGSRVVCPPQDLVDGLEATVHGSRVTHLSLVPTAFERWLGRRGDRPVPPSLECVLLGGAAAPTRLLERAREQGWPVRTTYGLTEAGSQVATARPDSPLGSVGPPLPGVRIQIVDETGRPASSGRILVQSPGQCVGYLDDAQAAPEWIHTDDLGRLDAAGNLWIQGRRSDLIISGGENVDPVEVESVLAEHPAIVEVGVAGLPDAEWGEAVTAFLVERPGHALQLDELRAFCATRLARFKCPRRLVRVERLPRTPTGKLRRAALRALAPAV